MAFGVAFLYHISRKPTIHLHTHNTDYTHTDTHTSFKWFCVIGAAERFFFCLFSCISFSFDHRHHHHSTFVGYFFPFVSMCVCVSGFCILFCIPTVVCIIHSTCILYCIRFKRTTVMSNVIFSSYFLSGIVWNISILRFHLLFRV